MPLILALSVMAGISIANIYYCQPLLNMISEGTGLSTFEVNLMPVFTQVGIVLSGLFAGILASRVVGGYV